MHAATGARGWSNIPAPQGAPKAHHAVSYISEATTRRAEEKKTGRYEEYRLFAITYSTDEAFDTSFAINYPKNNNTPNIPFAIVAGSKDTLCDQGLDAQSIQRMPDLLASRPIYRPDLNLTKQNMSSQCIFVKHRQAAQPRVAHATRTRTVSPEAPRPHTNQEDHPSSEGESPRWLADCHAAVPSQLGEGLAAHSLARSRDLHLVAVTRKTELVVRGVYGLARRSALPCWQPSLPFAAITSTAPHGRIPQSRPWPPLCTDSSRAPDDHSLVAIRLSSRTSASTQLMHGTLIAIPPFGMRGLS